MTSHLAESFILACTLQLLQMLNTEQSQLGLWAWLTKQTLQNCNSVCPQAFAAFLDRCRLLFVKNLVHVVQNFARSRNEGVRELRGVWAKAQAWLIANYDKNWKSIIKKPQEQFYNGTKDCFDSCWLLIHSETASVCSSWQILDFYSGKKPDLYNLKL